MHSKKVFLLLLFLCSSASAGTIISCAGELLDPDGYLEYNPDLKAAGVDACKHYGNHGRFEGRDPDPKKIRKPIKCDGILFDPNGYLAKYQDIRNAGIDACEHFSKFGKDEGRDPNPLKIGIEPIVINPSSLLSCAGTVFDPQGYLKTNPDLVAAGVNACDHFKSHGKSEGRNPNPFNLGILGKCDGVIFDPKGYIEANLDLQAAGVNACDHFKSHGNSEGRNPNPKNLSSLISCADVIFEPNGYLIFNPDLRAAGVNPCEHFKSHGKSEGRNPNPRNLGNESGLATGGNNGGATTSGSTTGSTTSGYYQTGLTNDLSYQLDVPQSVYPPTGEMWDNIRITFPSDYKLKVHPDTRGWSLQAEELRYKVENATKWLTQDELESIDFSNQAGNDISIYAGKLENGIWKMGSTFVHFKGTPTSNVPSFVKRHPENRMPQFVYNFPNFDLPGKMNVITFQQLDSDFNNVSADYLNKGFSAGSKGPPEKTILSEYDDWAYSHGCPRHNQPAALEWIKKNNIQDLHRWFNEGVIGPANGKAFAFIDFEAWGYGIGDQDIINKLGTLFRKFHEKNPTTTFTSYVNANPIGSVYSPNISSQEKDEQNAKYQKSFQEVKRGFWLHEVRYLDVQTGEFTGETGNLGEFITPVVGDYLHHVGFTMLYSYIQDLEISKKFFGKVLTLNWGINEGVIGSDYEGFGKAFKKSNGYLFLHENKPPIQPSYAYNITAWSNFLGDGTWWWDEPLPFLEGFDFHGGNSKPTNNDGYLPNDFSPKNFGSFHYAAQISYDYVARALFELSFYPGISGNIIMPEYKLEGVNYSGDKLLPASAEFYRLPIVRLRQFANGWVLIAINQNLNHWEKQKISVNVLGKMVDVELNGQFSTIKKID